MQQNRFYILLLFVVLVASCNKDFLNKIPLDQQTEATSFKTYENFKTYAWGLYDLFDGYGQGPILNTATSLFEEANSDNLCNTASLNSNPWAYQLVTIPSSGGDWDFSFIRRVNIMLDNIDQSSMSPAEKDHWKSVGYAFRSARYMQLLSKFGDVPWLEHVVKDNDKDILYGQRAPRDAVAQNILDNLLWAESHINPKGDGANTVNVHVVRALISRFGLFEGTWRKYQGLGNAEQYLQACRTASAKLAADFPTLLADYDQVFNSEDLGGKAGIILYRSYAAGQNMHGIQRYHRTTEWYFDVTKDAVESYLCQDGKPISTSSLYAGDRTLHDELRHRDRRLYLTVMPPYRVFTTTDATGNVVTSQNTIFWKHTGIAADREYMDTMATIASPGYKRLPYLQWAGNVLRGVPHFRKFNEGQAFGVSQLGYYFYKFYNATTDATGFVNTTDAPIFRIEEVLLNYAEASYELGEFDQSMAEQTINKLRRRVNMPAMIIADIDASFDLSRDTDVQPVLWEIRRERRVELIGEGFRFNDLRRWKKGNYLNKQQTGMWVDNTQYGNKLAIAGGGTEGYVEYNTAPSGWLEYYYLYPLPKDQLVLNSSLIQNTGWK
ncbi:RagB/SusD family nutrient uptake outer membrane protein [Agriterribacter sp.]|uniref:RagB/SusD family nutrient uptake outer membrane protein n=1 Tax=Agriterribacter sp. TaxID=2821509 RepID=UPI002CCDE8F8|nr:RagB/SusD family nutrient uptake outer membrane protein [Agriterribacter sp.]HRO45239.1 RagB/SusD family nutrient uptake outer membrane protein [Agriterribacter sp.]HRQ16842.1 RagB/SusD family nutrient uptake outer membrane protein [Agriterribacter sp.]